MDKAKLKDQILYLRSLSQEGEYWDFKKEWYTDKSDLLHDIICMANNCSGKDGLIIIGIDEETDYSFVDVSKDPNRKKTRDIVCFLRDKKFAGGIRPTVFVHAIKFGKYELDVIIIQNDKNTPYYLTENYQGVFLNNIYTRIGDTNTPKNKSADINVIEKLWRKHFGIDLSANEKVKHFLTKPEEWVDSKGGYLYHKFYPEFTIRKDYDQNSRNAYEFFMFGYKEVWPSLYRINIYCHQTLIEYMNGYYLDGGRYFTSSPKISGFSLDEKEFDWDVSYRYYVKGSIEHIVHEFYITDDMDEKLTARKNF